MEAGGKTKDAKVEGGATPGAGGEEDMSMEEILQSIRRIIAEDDKDPKKTEAKPNGTKAKDEDVPGSDVFELTDMVKDDGTIVDLKTEAPAPPIAPAGNKDVLQNIDDALTPEKKPEVKVEPPKAATAQNDIDAMFAAAPAPVAPVAPAPESVAPPADSLLSSEAASSSMQSINKLKSADQYVPPAAVTPAPSFRDGTTVEDLVTEMLRPMMKAWLDNNLPQIVERIVEREIRKLTK